MPTDNYSSLLRMYATLAPCYDTKWKTYVAASVCETLKRVCIRPGDWVLDVGCGTGELLKAISLAVPEARLAGVDMSPEMLAIARAKSRDDLDLREGRAEALPFENEVCDMVVSSSAFHFFWCPTTALAEMRRGLRPSGDIVITDWCSDYPACFLYDLFLRLFSSTHFRTYSSKKFHQLLNEAKFYEVTVRRYKIDRGWGMMTATAKKNAHNNVCP